MKKVIATSVFNGSGIKNRQGFYWACLSHFIRGYLNIFPDWEIWIYHDSSLYSNFYGSVLLHLEEKGLVKLICMDSEAVPLCEAMLWRLIPLFDSSVDIVLCRDVDHVPTGKELAIVNKFLLSDTFVLGINDNPAHTIPLMGGLCGFKSKELLKVLKGKYQNNITFEELIKIYKNTRSLDTHGDDQNFLNLIIYPLVVNNMSMYSPINRSRYKNIKYVYNNITLSHIENLSPILLEESENYCDFMGVASNQSPDKYVSFIDTHGDKTTISTIQAAEKQTFVNRTSDSRYEFTCSSENKKKVVLSCNFNLDYLFYLPIVTLLWQKYTGFQPIVYLVGSLKRWLTPSLELFVIKESRKLGAEIYFLPYISEYKDSTIAQLSRLYAACNVMYPNSYFLLSDIDMLPLSRDWFNTHVEGKTMDIKYPTCCGPGNYPICYVGATSIIWREMMGLQLDTEIPIEKQIEKQLQVDIAAGGDSFIEWCYDEQLLSKNIKAWTGHPDKCNINTRDGCPPHDRIDRSNWPTTIEDISKFVDCHSLRPGYTAENWPKILKLLTLKLTPSDLILIKQYQSNFIDQLNKKE